MNSNFSLCLDSLLIGWQWWVSRTVLFSYVVVKVRLSHSRQSKLTLVVSQPSIQAWGADVLRQNDKMLFVVQRHIVRWDAWSHRAFTIMAGVLWLSRIQHLHNIYEDYRLLRWYVPAYCYHAHQSTSLELNWSFQHFLEWTLFTRHLFRSTLLVNFVHTSSLFRYTPNFGACGLGPPRLNLRIKILNPKISKCPYLPLCKPRPSTSRWTYWINFLHRLYWLTCIHWPLPYSIL